MTTPETGPIVPPPDTRISPVREMSPVRVETPVISIPPGLTFRIDAPAETNVCFAVVGENKPVEVSPLKAKGVLIQTQFVDPHNHVKRPAKIYICVDKLSELLDLS